MNYDYDDDLKQSFIMYLAIVAMIILLLYDNEVDVKSGYEECPISLEDTKHTIWVKDCCKYLKTRQELMKQQELIKMKKE